MPGPSEAGARVEERFDTLAKAAAGGISRRGFARVLGGVALAAVLPSWARPARTDAAMLFADPRVKASGTCPAPPESETAQYYKGVCGDHAFFNLDKDDIIVGCKGDWLPVGLGVTSGFNGCGPEGGIDLPVFGKGDYVPDRPFGIANFYSACEGHDCCYGNCTSAKADCDHAFLQDLVRTCEHRYGTPISIFDGLLHGYCLGMALTYFAAVSQTSKGTEAYNAAKSPMCACCVTCEENARIEGVPDPGRFQYCGDLQNGSCVDIQTDNQNCGGCGNVCSGDASMCCHGSCHTAYECDNS